MHRADGFDIADHLRPGDTVVIGQATAEPPALVEQLIAAAQSIDGITAFCGYCLTDAWDAVTPGRPHIKGYAGHGALRRLGERGLLDMIPCHYSALDELIASGRIPVDVALLQVAPANDDGNYDLGPTIDYAVRAAEHARAVLVEVHADMPCSHAERKLPAASVTAAIDASRQLPGSPAREPTHEELRVAAHVAELIPSGATVQLGASGLADAVAQELRDREDLRIRSGLVGDWLVDLHEAGALYDGPGGCVTGMALGSERLYDFLRTTAVVEFVPIDEQVAAAAMADCQFISINSAIEVDLVGQVNSEVVGGRYVGAVGGQVDFFRAARASNGGLAVVAMASTFPSGASRIVTELAGPVTTLKSDVDIVVTEWGAADLRAASLTERAELLAQVAHPDRRDELLARSPHWL